MYSKTKRSICHGQQTFELFVMFIYVIHADLASEPDVWQSSYERYYSNLIAAELGDVQKGGRFGRLSYFTLTIKKCGLSAQFD